MVTTDRNDDDDDDIMLAQNSRRSRRAVKTDRVTAQSVRLIRRVKRGRTNATRAHYIVSNPEIRLSPRVGGAEDYVRNSFTTR